MAVIDDKNFQDVISELAIVAHKWKSIGEALRCPPHKLTEIERTLTNHTPADCLSDMLAYRKNQLTPSRLTWGEIIKALREKNVEEEVLANSIAEQYCPSEYKQPVIDDNNFQDVISELAQVAHKWKSIGEALRCPPYKLMQIERAQANHTPADCLSDMLAYRKNQLTPSRLTWREIIKALREKNVEEEVLANSIAEQYCPSEYKQPPEYKPPPVVNGKRDKKPQVPGQAGFITGSRTIRGIGLVCVVVVLGIIIQSQRSGLPTHDPPLASTGPTPDAPPTTTREPASTPLPSPNPKILDECPKLRDVDLIKWKDGNEIKEFRLINLIISKCDKISTQFNIATAVYRGWETQKRGTPDEICHAVLQHWLDSGTGRYPITWSGLIEVLKDVELGEVAKQLKTALLNKTHK